MTWLSSAIGVGLAVGAPAAGRLIDLSGARAGSVLAAAAGAAAFVTCLAGFGRLRTPPPGTGAGPAPAALHIEGSTAAP
jgi:MFS family permease